MSTRWIPLTFDPMFSRVMVDPDILKPMLSEIMSTEAENLRNIEVQKSFREVAPVDFEVKLDLYTEVGKVPVNVELQRRNNLYLAKRSFFYLCQMNKFQQPNKLRYNIPDTWTIWLLEEHHEGIQDSYFHGTVLGEHGEDLNFGAHFVFIEYKTFNDASMPLLLDLCNILRSTDVPDKSVFITDYGPMLEQRIKDICGDEEMISMYDAFWKEREELEWEHEDAVKDTIKEVTQQVTQQKDLEQLSLLIALYSANRDACCDYVKSNQIAQSLKDLAIQQYPTMAKTFGWV